MTSICFYFQVHQPYRIKNYNFFSIGHDPYYLDDKKNYEIVRKVGDKCYIPTTNVLLDLIKKHKDKFQVSFSISGVAIEQFKKWYPEVLENFKKLADTGQVEFLAETYYHSLSSLISEDEFHTQVEMHAEVVKREFGQTPRSFRNTELIYSDHIAWLAKERGFETILLEGAERILNWRSPNFVYRAEHNDIRCMLKNYKLSDDIAFRFSEKGWVEHPLTAEKYANWLHSIAGSGDVVNLFMDFETFGEHQWEDSGIFEFLRNLPDQVFKHPDFEFLKVSDAAQKHNVVGSINTSEPVSWADMERDLSAWLGNSMQREAFHSIYELQKDIYRLNNPEFLDIFRKLQTSDHFYYMCTKYFNDGDVHKYFNPYNSPYDAYIYFMNVLQDFRQRLDFALQGSQTAKASQIAQSAKKPKTTQAAKKKKKTGTAVKPVKRRERQIEYEQPHIAS